MDSKKKDCTGALESYNRMQSQGRRKEPREPIGASIGVGDPESRKAPHLVRRPEVDRDNPFCQPFRNN